MGELMGIARFRFKEGRREEFERLSAQAMEIVKARELGTLQYDTFMNDDRSECVVIERYRDSEAALEHFKNVGHLFDPIFETVTLCTASSSASRMQRSEQTSPVATSPRSSRRMSR